MRLLVSIRILHYFNSIKVRLKLNIEKAHVTKRQYFNSIKVRLKLSSEKICNYEHQFQFHKGTIKTLLKRLFIKHYLYFNSIKVRLKHANVVSSVESVYSISIP